MFNSLFHVQFTFRKDGSSRYDKDTRPMHEAMRPKISFFMRDVDNKARDWIVLRARTHTLQQSGYRKPRY